MTPQLYAAVYFLGMTGGLNLQDWTLKDKGKKRLDIAGLDIGRLNHRDGHSRTGHWKTESQGWT